MEALIVHDDKRETLAIGKEIQKQGFRVRFCLDQGRAITHVRKIKTDLLVLKQVIGGRHTTGVALAAELNNPSVSTVLLTSRSREDSIEQFELVPSIRAILDADLDPKFLGSLAKQIKQKHNTRTLILSPLDRKFPILNRKVA